MSAVSGPSATLDVALAHAARLLEAQPELAVSQAEEILRTVGDHPPTRLLLAKAHAACGRTDDALAGMDRLVRTHPRWPSPWLESGLLLGRLGRGDEAIRALKTTLQLAPNQPVAWLTLADHLSAIGDAAGAESAQAQ